MEEFVMNPELADYCRKARARDAGIPLVVYIQGPTGTLKTRSIKRALDWFVEMNRTEKAMAEKDYFFPMMVNAYSQVDPKSSLAGLFVAGGSYTEAVEAAKEIGVMSRVHILFVDDIGAEAAWCPAQTMAAGLCDLLDRRYDSGLPTVMTGNLTGSEFLLRYGARLHSRAFVGAKKIVMTGEDLRRVS